MSSTRNIRRIPALVLPTYTATFVDKTNKKLSNYSRVYSLNDGTRCRRKCKVFTIGLRTVRSGLVFPTFLKLCILFAITTQGSSSFLTHWTSVKPLAGAVADFCRKYSISKKRRASTYLRLRDPFPRSRARFLETRRWRSETETRTYTSTWLAT